MPEVNKVVDLSHHNQNLDFSQMKTAGNILGIIHKATQRVKYVDPTYQPHSTAALKVNLWWGAYHFGINSSAILRARRNPFFGS